MDWLVWLGALVAALGLAGLVYCIAAAIRLRSGRHPEAERRDRLQRMVAVNAGALAVSALGLMLVVVGILLG